MRFRPTRPLRFARPSGKCRERELSSSRGVPTPLQATTTTSAFHPTLHAVGVVVDAPVPHPVLADGDLPPPAPGLELHAAPERRRPVRDVRARLRALGAPDQACTRI